MAQMIKRGAPTVWMLVKVPRITEVDSGTDATARLLRTSAREHHFGGETATVRKLTERELAALSFIGRGPKATPTTQKATS